MRLKTILAALLMISLLAGCSLPVRYVAELANMPNAPQSSAASFEEEALLTQEDAKLIALHHAKAPEADAHGLQIAFEYDDGIPEYDISFYFMDYEYEYEIHGTSGRIVSYEREKH